MAESARDRCHCGVYRYAHDQGRGCGNFHKASRLRVWFQDHSLHHHVEAFVWVRVPEKWRWKIAGWLHDRRPDLCWCDMVMAALAWEEGADDLCDVRILSNVGPWVPGQCYCDPDPLPQSAALTSPNEGAAE